VDTHLDRCWSIVAAMLRDQAPTRPERSVLRRVLEANLNAQGSSAEAFWEHTDAAASRQPIAAGNEGFLRVDLPRLRAAIVDFQGPAGGPPYVWSDRAGVVLVAAPGSWVNRHDVIATVRCPTEAVDRFVDELSRAIVVEPALIRSTSFETIRDFDA
jgi:hypothetical protein